MFIPERTLVIPEDTVCIPEDTGFIPENTGFILSAKLLPEGRLGILIVKLANC